MLHIPHFKGGKSKGIKKLSNLPRVMQLVYGWVRIWTQNLCSQALGHVIVSYYRCACLCYRISTHLISANKKIMTNIYTVVCSLHGTFLHSPSQLILTAILILKKRKPRDKWAVLFRTPQLNQLESEPGASASASSIWSHGLFCGHAVVY